MLGAGVECAFFFLQTQTKCKLLSIKINFLFPNRCTDDLT